MPAAPNGMGGSSAWQEAGILGFGARGPVILVSSEGVGGGSPQRSALKRSSADEIRALNALARCRNIVTLQEHFKGDNGSEVWARLEWLEGGSLRNLLRSQGPGKLNEDAARFVVAEILFGLQEIHQLRWMHRDVKAENIGLTTPVFTESGQAICRVKLMDFDTAVPVARGEQLTEVVGTVENMAPEVFDGSYDEAADCWSLGVVAYEMLFGYRPFNDVCIDNVEEMVRNWRRYLMVPSDAGAAFSNFVSRLLSAPKDRMSSCEASAHQWLRSAPGGAHGPACTAAAASAISESARRQSTALECQAAALRPHSPAKGNSSFSYERRASAPASPLGPEELPLSKVPRRCSVPAGNLDEKDAVESLSRIRRSLSEWNAPSLGTVYSSSSQGNATARVLSTASDANSKSSGSQSARRPDRPARKGTADSANSEIGASRRGFDAEGSSSTSAAQSQRRRSKELGAKSASTSPAAGCGLAPSAIGGIEKEGTPVELTPTPKGVSGHLEYLRRVRSRTQEVVEIAEAMAARRTSSSTSTMSLAAAVSTPGISSQLSTPSSPSKTSQSRLMTGLSTVESRSERHAETSAPSAGSSRRGGDPDRQRFPTDSIFRPGDDSKSSVSPIEHLEEHLGSARARTQELLSRLSRASTDQALPTRSTTATELHAKLLRESRQAAEASAIDSDLQASRHQRSSSPTSWLAEQRRRTEWLLGRLGRASAEFQGLAAAADKPRSPTAFETRWAGHVAGHLPSRSDVDAGTAWPSILRQHIRHGDVGREEPCDKAHWVSA